MINSRSIDDLHPRVAAMCRDFFRRCKAAGLDVLLTSTYRDAESQTALYAIGRTVKGANPRPSRPMGDTVTNAKAGESWHNYRCAFDVVPLRYGKPVWGRTGADLALWKAVGAIGKSCGLEWAGDWRSFTEFPHFQFTGGLTLADLKAGKAIPMA